MLAKLTLTVDQEVVERAKRYAKRKHRSVSRIIEDYLRIISMEESLGSDDISSSAVTTDRLTGMFRNEDTGQDYDDILEDALDQAHG